jgi:hypothetical protein
MTTTTLHFQPPANLTDFDPLPHQRDAWHVSMATFFRQAIARTEQLLGKGNSQLYDPTRTSLSGAVAEQVITWAGFPKTLYEGRTKQQAWQAAEQLVSFKANGRTAKARPQDEYLEWHTTRDPHGRITAVDFTCEGPEYWAALAHGYPDSIRPGHGAPAAKGDLNAVVALYQQYVSPEVKREDLLLHGRYDPWNRWNTELGAMHLTHPSNSLSAEVYLAGDATVLREKNGQVLTDDDDLIACALYGVATRASDPRIGGAVNALARTAALISLKNPVGLYIDGLDTTGWTKPDGQTPVGNYWTILRGNPNAIVRARFEVPKSEGFVVSDILIGGEPITYAGQIAEHITVKLTGLAGEAGKHQHPAVGCEAAAAGPSLLAAEEPADSALVRLHTRSLRG